MRSKLMVGLMLMGVMAWVSPVVMGGPGCGGHKTEAVAGSPTEAGRVDVEETYLTLAASLPSVQYRIGEDTTCCAKSAAMAKEAGKAVKYVVGTEIFENETEAEAKVAAAIGAKLQELRSLQFSVAGESLGCPMTAQKIAAEKGTTVAYRVGGIDFPDREKAQKAVELVKDAGNDLKISYKVGDKSFCCSKMAGAECSKSGKNMTYVVGSEEAGCEKDAGRLLAKAQVRAIVTAAASVLAM